MLPSIVRCVDSGRICRVRREPGALTSALQRGAARHRARRASVGAVLGAAVLEEGEVEGEAVECGRGGGRGMGEARAESLVGNVGEAVVGVAGESSRLGVGTPGGGVAHRGRLLEGDADAAAGGVFDGLPELVVEVVSPQAVTGKSQGGEMGAGARATHPSDRRTWPRSTQRTIEGSIGWMRARKGCRTQGGS